MGPPLRTLSSCWYGKRSRLLLWARFGQFLEGVSEAVDVGGVGRRPGLVAAWRLVAHGVGRVHGDGLVEALVDVPAGVLGEVLADVDDDGNLWLGEGEEQAPFSPEVDDAESVDALAGQAVAGGVASDALQRLDGGHERGLDATPQSAGGLATERCPADPEPGRGQRSALERSS
jgi:hypothetical protein